MRGGHHIESHGGTYPGGQGKSPQGRSLRDSHRYFERHSSQLLNKPRPIVSEAT